MLPMKMVLVVFNHDEITDLYMLTHTYGTHTEATKAISNHVTLWLLTADGRRFVREHGIDSNKFPWQKMLEHPKVLKKAPGILEVELLPYTSCPVYEDDTVSPWWIDFRANCPKGRHLLDKEKVRELLDQQ
jgi:hypothetical protein